MKKAAILNAAARLFAERGFSGASAVLLAQEAGVAEGTLFRHFKTKDEIFSAVVSGVSERVIRGVSAHLESCGPETGRAEVLAIARAFCLFMRENRMESVLVSREASGRYGAENDRGFRAVRAMYAQLADMARGAVERGLKDGSVGAAVDPGVASSLLVCFFLGFVRGQHFGLVPPAQEDDLTALLLSGIAAVLGPEPPAGVRPPVFPGAAGKRAIP
jgi:AcrR family transcriptional regulator